MQPITMARTKIMMKKKVVFICFSSIFLFAATCLSASWQFMGFNRYRDAFYVDEERVERMSDGTIKLWTKLTVNKKSLFRRVIKEDFERVPKRVDEVKYLEMMGALDCQGQRIKHLELIYYNYKDRPLLKIVTPQAKWKSVVPGSLWYELLHTSCEKYNQPKQK